MKVPKTLKLNGVDYKVEMVPGLNDGADVLYGMFDETEQTIKINPSNQTETGQCRTFLHEMLHAILYENDIANQGYNHRMPKDEEELCEMLSRSLYQIIQDNAAIFVQKGA